MAGCSYFLLLFAVLAVASNFTRSHEVDNLRFLFRGEGKLLPKFSPNETIVSYSSFPFDQLGVYEIDVTESFPQSRLMSSGEAAFSLGYFNETHMVQAVNVPNASLTRKRTIYNYQAALVDRDGKIVYRYSNFIGAMDFFIFGYKSGYIMGVKNSTSKASKIVLTQLATGFQTFIDAHHDYSFVNFAVFHKTRDLIFYSSVMKNGTTVYSCDYSGNNKEVVYQSAPGEKSAIFDVNHDGTYLFACRMQKLGDDDCESGIIHVGSSKFEPLTLQNEPFYGLLHSLSHDEKYLVFVRDGGPDIGELYVVDWNHKDINNGTLIYVCILVLTAVLVLVGLALIMLYLYVKKSNKVRKVVIS